MNDLLSALVTGAAAKRLTAVEARPDRSNQHEFNGVQALKTLFGEVRATLDARFVYVSEDETDVTPAEGFVTWYDAREDHPTRSEFRLYFPRTDASEKLQEGDLGASYSGGQTVRSLSFLLAKGAPPSGSYCGCSILHPLSKEWKSGISDVMIPRSALPAREVLAQLGIEPADQPTDRGVISRDPA